MKSYHDKGGNLVKGTTILEDLLQSQRKAQNLVAVLDRFNLRVSPAATPADRKIDWIIPAE